MGLEDDIRREKEKRGLITKQQKPASVNTTIVEEINLPLLFEAQDKLGDTIMDSLPYLKFTSFKYVGKTSDGEDCITNKYSDKLESVLSYDLLLSSTQKQGYTEYKYLWVLQDGRIAFAHKGEENRYQNMNHKDIDNYCMSNGIHERIVKWIVENEDQEEEKESSLDASKMLKKLFIAMGILIALALLLYNFV